MINHISVILFGVTILYIATTSRISAFVMILSVQGVMLFLASLAQSGSLNVGHTIFLALETIVVKAAVLPMVIYHMIRSMGIKRETDPFIGSFAMLMLSTIIMSLSFVLSSILKNAGSNINVLNFSVSLSAVIIGMLIITTRRKIISHVMGFLVLENGAFMMSLSLAPEMPLIVEAGILFDVLIGMFLTGIFANNMKSAFEDSDVSRLTRLSD
ncbi:MAG: hydrogenase [Nitrospirae bacterium YQR-1]